MGGHSTYLQVKGNTQVWPAAGPDTTWGSIIILFTTCLSLTWHAAHVSGHSPQAPTSATWLPSL